MLKLAQNHKKSAGIMWGHSFQPQQVDLKLTEDYYTKSLLKIDRALVENITKSSQKEDELF